MSIKCTRCKAYKNPYNINCIPFSGNSSPDFYFLGEMAGREEAYASLKEPSHFIGKAGDKLNKFLRIAGVERDEIAIANSLRCYKEGNATPTKVELDACFFHTLLEVNKLNPKVIVTLGECALYQATSYSGIREYRGRLIWSDKVKRKVFPTYHPAAVIYDPSKLEILIEDFKKLKGLLDQEPNQIKYYEYSLIESKEQFNSILTALQQANNLYLDIETTGLNVFEDEIVLIQLGVDALEPIYIITNKILNSIKDELKSILEEKLIIGQGFDFDARFLYTQLGIQLKNWNFDTCIAEYLITGIKDNDLTFLTGLYARESFGYDTKVKQTGGFHKVQNREIALSYAANDVGVLYKIKPNQERLLKKQNQYKLFNEIWMPSNRILTEMSLRGILVDTKKLQEIDFEYKTKSKDLLNSCKELASVQACEKHFSRKFNPRSTLMLRWLMLDHYKLPVIKTKVTPKGEKNPVLSEKVMSIYADKYKNEYASLMKKYRSYQTLRENFLSGLLPKLHKNVAHTTYSLHATTTGRPNSKDPNLLNLPGGKETKQIKSCFIARPNKIFVYSDLSQIEVKVAAIVYEEPRLIEICNGGRDFHCEITSRILDIPYETVFEGKEAGDPEITAKRRIFKRITFGVLYQQEKVSLAFELGITENEADNFIKEYYKGFPNLKTNIELTKQEVIEKGELANLFGFRRRWKFHKPEDQNTLREAVNFKVQSTAFNLLQIAMIRINKDLKSTNAYLVMQVYDSLGAETLEEEKRQVCKIMKYNMEDCNKDIPLLAELRITADVEMGYNLMNLKKVM